MTDRAQKIVAFGCTHHPLHDPAAIDFLLDTVVKEKPDVIVHLGDGIEANAASQWDDAKELAIDLGAEYDASNAFLADLRKAAPRARRKYLSGNHESNVTRAGRLDKRIRTICNWSNPRNQPELENWEVGKDYNYSHRLGSFWLGPICFSHGYETTTTQQEVEAIYFTRNWPYSLYVSAHTHRPARVDEIMFRNTLPMSRWRCNVGCLRDMNPSYMERNRKWAWGQGVFVGEAKPLKSPRLSKEWDGEIRVFKMYDEAA